MENYILFTIIYLASMMYNTKWYKDSYSKCGRWYNLEYCFLDFIWCYAPFVNTIVVLFNIFDSPYKSNNERSVF